MFTLTQFTAVVTATGAQLDQNNRLLGAVAPMPCTIAGTNDLVFTQQTAGSGSVATTIAVTAYQTGMQICGIAASSNSGATTARIGALSALNVYKPSPLGPVVLAGGEIVAGCAITLLYDAALNGSAGGWHLIATASAITGATIVPGLVRPSIGIQMGDSTNPTLTMIKNGSATLAFTALVPNATAEQLFSIAGVSLSDRIAWNFPQPVSAGLILSGYVVAANSVQATLGVRMANVTAASTITPGTVTVGATAFRIA